MFKHIKINIHTEREHIFNPNKIYETLQKKKVYYDSSYVFFHVGKWERFEHYDFSIFNIDYEYVLNEHQKLFLYNNKIKLYNEQFNVFKYLHSLKKKIINEIPMGFGKTHVIIPLLILDSIDNIDIFFIITKQTLLNQIIETVNNIYMSNQHYLIIYFTIWFLDFYNKKYYNYVIQFLSYYLENKKNIKIIFIVEYHFMHNFFLFINYKQDDKKFKFESYVYNKNDIEFNLFETIYKLYINDTFSCEFYYDEIDNI